VRFTGQFRDTETGEDYFNARYFGAALGRLISPDPMNAGANPADPQTWNAYAYVRNDPLNATEQSPLKTFYYPLMLQSVDSSQSASHTKMVLYLYGPQKER